MRADELATYEISRTVQVDVPLGYFVSSVRGVPSLATEFLYDMVSAAVRHVREGVARDGLISEYDVCVTDAQEVHEGTVRFRRITVAPQRRSKAPAASERSTP